MDAIIFIVYCYFEHAAQRTFFMHVVRGKSLSRYNNDLYVLVAKKQNNLRRFTGVMRHLGRVSP